MDAHENITPDETMKLLCDMYSSCDGCPFNPALNCGEGCYKSMREILQRCAEKEDSKSAANTI